MMISLALPKRPDRPLLMSFWLALCTFAGAALLLIILLGGEVVVGIVGGVLLVAGTVAGFVRESLVVKAYGLWDRAARKVGRLAEVATLRTCYYLVLTPVGRIGGSELPLRAPTPAASGWVPHEIAGRTTEAGVGSGRVHGSALQPGRPGWVTQLARGSIGSRRPWMFALIPYLALLRWYTPSKADGSVSGHNYTLY